MTNPTLYEDFLSAVQGKFYRSKANPGPLMKIVGISDSYTDGNGTRISGPLFNVELQGVPDECNKRVSRISVANLKNLERVSQSEESKPTSITQQSFAHIRAQARNSELRKKD